MATIFEGLTQALSSSAAQNIGKLVGLEPDLVSKGIGVVGPLITTALANKASTPNGLTELMQLLPKDSGSILGNVASLVKGSSGNAAVASVFGSGSSAIASSLDRVLGFKASSLLPIATPLVLGLISKIAGEKKLDANGVAQLLTNEAADFQQKGGDAVRVVRSAVDTGQQAADLKAKYSAVQWESVRLAPVAASYVVMMADKSGPVGAAKEITAAAGAIHDAKASASPTSVVGLAFDAELSKEELTKFVTGKSRDDAISIVRDAIGSVDQNSPADAADYRRLLADVAMKVANASKEGGVFGIGGTRVSASEQAAIDEINAVLGKR